jgi:hypothetical protein
MGPVFAGNGKAMKQDSPYYEFYYKWLTPMKHFVPFNYSLADLVGGASE